MLHPKRVFPFALSLSELSLNQFSTTIFHHPILSSKLSQVINKFSIQALHMWHDKQASGSF